MGGTPKKKTGSLVIGTIKEMDCIWNLMWMCESYNNWMKTSEGIVQNERTLSSKVRELGSPVVAPLVLGGDGG